MEISISTLSPESAVPIWIRSAMSAVFSVVLKNVAPERRRRVNAARIIIALVVLFRPSCSVAAIVLRRWPLRPESITRRRFAVSDRCQMLFPPREGTCSVAYRAEPFIFRWLFPCCRSIGDGALMLMTNSAPAADGLEASQCSGAWACDRADPVVVDLPIPLARRHVPPALSGLWHLLVALSRTDFLDASRVPALPEPALNAL